MDMEQIADKHTIELHITLTTALSNLHSTMHSLCGESRLKIGNGEGSMLQPSAIGLSIDSFSLLKASHALYIRM